MDYAATRNSLMAQAESISVLGLWTDSLMQDYFKALDYLQQKQQQADITNEIVEDDTVYIGTPTAAIWMSTSAFITILLARSGLTDDDVMSVESSFGAILGGP